MMKTQRRGRLSPTLQELEGPTLSELLRAQEQTFRTPHKPPNEPQSGATMNETAQGNYVLYSDLEAAHKRIAELEAFRDAVRGEKKKFSQQAKDAKEAGDITWAARLLGCEIRLSALLEKVK